MTAKEIRLANLCSERQKEGAILRRRANIAWLTDGADVHVDRSNELGIATLVWTPGRKRVFTSDIEAQRLRDEELPEEWEIITRPWTDDAPAFGDNLLADWPLDSIAPLRFELTDIEIQRARLLGRDAAAVLEDILKQMEPGLREHEVAGRIAGRLRALGIATPVLLVGADERIARFRHPIPTNERIQRACMAVVCAERQGLTVALTRIVHFGPLTDDLDRRHDACCRIDAFLHARTRPGVRWADLLSHAIGLYQEYGFPEEWKRHHQGGPLGYATRDFLATPTETRSVCPNQLVAWNPSITGTKSEDTILSSGEVVTGTGAWPLRHGRPDILVR